MLDMQEANYNAIADLCNWDFKDPESQMAYRKRSKLNTDSIFVYEDLNKLCPGIHEHQHLEGSTRMQVDGEWVSINRTVFSGWYTDKFCDAILDAYEKHFHSLDHNGDVMPVDDNLLGG